MFEGSWEYGPRTQVADGHERAITSPEHHVVPSHESPDITSRVSERHESTLRGRQQVIVIIGQISPVDIWWREQMLVDLHTKTGTMRLKNLLQEILITCITTSIIMAWSHLRLKCYVLPGREWGLHVFVLAFSQDRGSQFHEFNVRVQVMHMKSMALQ